MIKKNKNKLSNLSLFFKKKIIEISYFKKAHHIGSCLSCVDILVVLFFGVMKHSKNNTSSKMIFL